MQVLPNFVRYPIMNTDRIHCTQSWPFPRPDDLLRPSNNQKRRDWFASRPAIGARPPQCFQPQREPPKQAWLA